ncbi:MAG: hypothetical protein P4M11_07790 [Candidatus Pacebacteria bacterium]|nr:hypothetical protein [Candidatus Paceibacterota bacterium]
MLYQSLYKIGHIDQGGAYRQLMTLSTFTDRKKAVQTQPRSWKDCIQISLKSRWRRLFNTLVTLLLAYTCFTAMYLYVRYVHTKGSVAFNEDDSVLSHVVDYAAEILLFIDIILRIPKHNSRRFCRRVQGPGNA